MVALDDSRDSVLKVATQLQKAPTIAAMKTSFPSSTCQSSERRPERQNTPTARNERRACRPSEHCLAINACGGFLRSRISASAMCLVLISA
jgi:hypothetical protein